MQFSRTGLSDHLHLKAYKSADTGHEPGWHTNQTLYTVWQSATVYIQTPSSAAASAGTYASAVPRKSAVAERLVSSCAGESNSPTLARIGSSDPAPHLLAGGGSSVLLNASLHPENAVGTCAMAPLG